MSTHVPTGSRLFTPLIDSHPERLYAFESAYLNEVRKQMEAQPTPALKALLEAELARAVEKCLETGKAIKIDHAAHWEAPSSGVPLAYSLVRPLSENWADALRQAPSKHEVYHLSPQEKANVRRDAYFYAIAVGAIAFDPERL